jgi:hypothetical protein
MGTMTVAMADRRVRGVDGGGHLNRGDRRGVDLCDDGR